MVARFSRQCTQSHTRISGVSTNERFAWNNERQREGTRANQFRVGYIRNSLDARNPTGARASRPPSPLSVPSFLILDTAKRKYANYGLKLPRYDPCLETFHYQLAAFEGYIL